MVQQGVGASRAAAAARPLRLLTSPGGLSCFCWWWSGTGRCLWPPPPPPPPPAAAYRPQSSLKLILRRCLLWILLQRAAQSPPWPSAAEPENPLVAMHRGVTSFHQQGRAKTCKLFIVTDRRKYSWWLVLRSSRLAKSVLWICNSFHQKFIILISILPYGPGKY